MKNITFTLLSLALAACSGEQQATSNEAKAEAAVAKIEASATGNVAPGLPIADKQAKLDPSALPPAFEGRWGMKPEDCDIARSDTRGLLSVTGSKLTFYDAAATATVIGGSSRYKVVADLALSDRGRKWQRRDTFELTNAGTVLQRTEQDTGKTYRYEHC